MSDKRAERMERLISRLQRGQRLSIDQRDSPDKDAIMTAAQLAAAREPHAAMRPEFKHHLAEMLRTQSREGFTRRTALAGGLAAAAGLVGGFGLEKLLEAQGSNPTGTSTAGSFVAPEPGRWVDVASVVDLPDGQAHPVTAGAVSGFVFRQGEAVSGVASTCSHFPCALDWDSGQRNIVCPCHWVRFTTSGQPIGSQYGVPPLKKLHVRVVRGRVQVLGT